MFAGLTQIKSDSNILTMPFDVVVGPKQLGNKLNKLDKNLDSVRGMLSPPSMSGGSTQ